MKIPSRAVLFTVSHFATLMPLARCQRDATAMLAGSVIVNKHGGTLRFETECGKGKAPCSLFISPSMRPPI
jgi:hypothetical protein